MALRETDTSKVCVKLEQFNPEYIDRNSIVNYYIFMGSKHCQHESDSPRSFSTDEIKYNLFAFRQKKYGNRKTSFTFKDNSL